MKKITKLHSGKNQEKTINVFLDGKFGFSLPVEVAVKEALKIGQELSDSQIEILAGSSRFHRCLGAATRYLSYRPRSEFEIRERLQRHGFTNDSIETTISKLKELGLVDDMAFAQFWKDNRETLSPRSQWLTRLELRRKGLNEETINEVVHSVNDDDSAYRAALTKVHRLPLTDYEVFRRRLGEYLRRRGFNYGVIDQAIKRVWQEWESNL